jgi:hypothetical protein
MHAVLCPFHTITFASLPWQTKQSAGLLTWVMCHASQNLQNSVVQLLHQSR